MPLPPLMHPQAAAYHVASAYEVAIANAGQLIPIKVIARLTLDVVFDAADQFRVACNRHHGTFVTFLRMLDQGGNPAGKLLALRQINVAFNVSLPTFPGPAPAARWIVFGAACAALTAPTRTELLRFYATRNAASAIRDIEAIFNAAGVGLGATVFEVIKAVMERGGDPTGITVAAIPGLVSMYTSHRPMSGFMGFTQWGPGDQGNQGANIEAHVLKHVCRQPLDVNFGISETVEWWRILGVRLTLANYNHYAVAPILQATMCFDGVQPLSGDRLRRFLVYHALSNEPALTTFVKNQALAPYRDYAIEHSRVMNNVIVHSNGALVFISGASGNAFIVGRFDGAQLGISSCYFPLNLVAKLAGARSNICWRLRA